MVVLNKADLADPEATRAWIRAYRARGWDAISFSANAGKGVKEAVSLVERAARPGRGAHEGQGREQDRARP